MAFIAIGFGPRAPGIKPLAMNILFNNVEIELPGDVATVADLLASRGVPAAGVAVAVNDRVVRKAAWGETRLADGDKVMVITAVCGG